MRSAKITTHGYRGAEQLLKITFYLNNIKKQAKTCIFNKNCIIFATENEETVTHIVYILSCLGTRYHEKRGNISSLLMFRQDNRDTVAYSTERR